ncbi:hypothetical protein DFH06DRAFT_616912 [Mycena polygramma]|nr:hypothetical protein DFH06DRAFT_616912 [Mycena polygramma]
MCSTKTPFTTIEIHPVPAHLSLKDFAAKMLARADACLARPVAQKNLLRYDIMIPNDRFDLEFKGLGFPKPRPMILVQIECESAESFREFLRDEEIVRLLSGGQEASMFSTDVVTRIDNSNTQSNNDLCTYLIVLKSPSHESAMQHYERTAKIADGFAGIPFVQRHFASHSAWIHNATLAHDASVLGLPATQPVVILKIQANSDIMMKAFTDADYQQYFADLGKANKQIYDADLCPRFAVDIIRKVDRA